MAFFEDMEKFLELLLDGEELRGEVVGTSQFTYGDIGWDVDTCETKDCGWETAICMYYKERLAVDWVVVERYPDRASAVMGHNKWCFEVETNHTTTFLSVQDPAIHILEVNI